MSSQEWREEKKVVHIQSVSFLQIVSPLTEYPGNSILNSLPFHW
jgi:hypothetical protein